VILRSQAVLVALREAKGEALDRVVSAIRARFEAGV